MTKHLTQQQLLDYQFKLASDAGMSEVRTHLERCEACRRRLDELARKFASLELLRDEIKPSDTLISKAVEYAAASGGTKAVPLWRLPWLGAVAAVVVVGLGLLLVSLADRRYKTGLPGADVVVRETIAPEAAKDRPVAETERTVAGVPAEGTAAPAVTMDRALALAPERPAAHSAGADPDAIRSYAWGRAGAPGAAPVSSDEVSEQPPFAPASAIELVVLPRRDSVQLTIYNSADLTLVRERRNLTLKRGWNWLQFMWANTLIDPTSLALEPLQHKDAVEVQQLVFPPRLRELGRWLIRSQVSGQVPFELTYFTSGLAWRAFYMGTLSRDEKTMRLEAYVRVSNGSGEDYEDAHTRLIVGEVHLLDQIRELAQRQYPYGSPLPVGRRSGMAGNADADWYFERNKLPMLGDMPALGGFLKKDLDAKEISKEGLSEYFLYTIEGTETIPNGWGKRLLSLEADDIPVTGLYKYDEQRWGAETIRFLSFANDEEHELGETPLPDGMVRIYGLADEQGHLSYVGGTGVKYIPVGEEVELNLGPARLVEVEPVLMDYRVASHIFDTRGDLSGWDEVRTWRIDVANAGTIPAKIEITRGIETPYWTLEHEGDASYEKHDATHARFKLDVEPRSRRRFSYTVTTRHGTRQEAVAEKEKRE